MREKWPNYRPNGYPLAILQLERLGQWWALSSWVDSVVNLAGSVESGPRGPQHHVKICANYLEKKNKQIKLNLKSDCRTETPPA